MKDYLLKKKELFNLPIKEIHYLLRPKETSKAENFKSIIVHHTQNRQTIQKIIDLHVKKKHWASIGYHFLIGKNGQIYQARDLQYAGAHAFGFNKNSIGIALFGNLTLQKPSPKQIDSLKKLIQTLKEEYSINTKNVLGHNQAAYLYLQHQFTKARLREVDPLTITNDLEYYEFMKETAQKIKIYYSGYEVEEAIDRLKTCPGINVYEHLKKIRGN